ncbi:MAG: hypothetical protein ACT4PI_03910 [Actinomycetota bacterium]
MTEGPMPPNDSPPNDSDSRDERLAALLEVPPLDDVTRRRLVRRALDEPRAVLGEDAERRRRTVRVVGAAAAALVVVAGATVVLRAGDDGGDTTAARPEGEEPTEDVGKGGTDEAAAPPSAFTDLGEVSDPSVLRERLGVLAAAPEPSAESEGDDTEERATGGAAVPPACLTPLEQAGAGSPTLAAGGTYQGTPALVLVAPKAGVATAFVLDAATCVLLSEVPVG